MDISNKDEFRRYTFTATRDRNAAKDNSESRISKGRPGLVKIDNYFADKAVTDAIEGNNHDV